MNTAVILWGLIFGSIGVGYFIYGGRRDNTVIRYTGVVLMIYPYFFENTIALVLVGCVLLFVPKFVQL